MATIAASGVSNLSNGTQVQQLGFTQRWRVNPLLGVAADLGIVDQGWTSNRYVSIGEFTAAAISENAAITGSALPTLDADSLTLANGGLSYEMTSEAYLSVVQSADLMEKLDIRALQAIAEYVASDSSVGIAALISTLSAVGTGGAALSFNTIRTGKATICNAVGTQELICILDLKGTGDLERSLETSGASQYANQAMSPLIEAMFVNGALGDEIGFTGIKYSGVSFFQVNRGSSQLYTSGTDTYGLLCALPPDRGSDIAPAIVLGFREKPAKVREMLANKVEHMTFMGKVPMSRWYGEPNTVNANTVRISYICTFDAIVHNASAALGVRYATS